MGREDPLEEEKATHSSILAWEMAVDRSLEGYSPRGRKELDTTEHMLDVALQVNGVFQRV